MSRNNSRIFMFVCTTVMYEYTEALMNGVNNLFKITHVRNIIYHENVMLEEVG